MGRKYKQDEINDILGDLGNVTQNNYVAPTVKSNVAPAMAVVGATNKVQDIRNTPNDIRTIKSLDEAKNNLLVAENDLNLKTAERKKKEAEIINNVGQTYNANFGALQPLSYENRGKPITALPEEKITRAELNNQLSKELEEERKSFENWKIANYENNLARANAEDVNLWDKTGGNITRAISDLFSPLTQGEAYQIKDEQGNKTYLPSYSELKQEAVQNSYGNNLLGKVAKTGGDILYGGTKILAASALDAATGGVGGKALYWTDMAADNYKRVKNKGYSDEDALKNTIIATGSEFLTERLLGGVSKTLTGGKTSELQNIISNSLESVSKNPNVARILGSMGAEGTEEFVQEWIGALNDKITLGENKDIKELVRDSLYSALVGAGTAGLTNASLTTKNALFDNRSRTLSSGAQQNVALSDVARQQVTQEQPSKTTQEPISTQQNVDNTKQLDYNNVINERESALNGREITGANQAGINQEINREQPTNDSRTSGEGDGGVRVLNEAKDYKQVKDNIDNLKATHKRGAFFDSYTEDEFKTFKTYQTPDGKSSISVKPDGDITALVSEGKKGMATDLLMKARENGGTKMDCYGKFLKELYEQHGFKAVARVHYGRGYNEQMDNYIDNAIKEGKAKDDSDFDIYFMMKNNDDIDTVRNNIGKYETTNIDELPYMDYDEAYNFRDSQLEQQESGEGETNSIVKSGEKTSTESKNDNTITIKNDNLKGVSKDKIKAEDTGVSIDGKSVRLEIPSNSAKNKLGQYVPKDGFTKSELKSGKLGDSKFYKNVTERADFISDKVRKKVQNDDYMKHYRKITNEESMQEAFDDLNTRGTEAIADFFNNDKELTSKDTAMGWLLIEQSQENGDYDFANQVLRKMRSNASKTGQTLQMYNYYARLTPEGMYKWCGDQLLRAEEIFEKGKTKKWIEENKDRWQLNGEETEFIKSQMERIQELNKMDDSDTTTIDVKGKQKEVTVDRAKQVEIAKIQALIESKIPPKKGQALNAWMRISMLGNLKTIGTRNPLGNIALRPINDIGDFASSLVDYAISKKTGVRTKGGFNPGAQVRGLARGSSETVQDARLGINTRNAKGNRFEIGQGKSFNEQHKGAAKVLNPLAKAGNKADSAVSFLLDLGDRPFYEATYQQSLENQMRLNGIKDMKDVPDWMKKIAEKEGLERTYQDDNNYTSAVIDIRNAMNKFNVKGYGLGDVIIPFAKTPANLTKAIVDYSPAGFVNAITKGKELRTSIENGQFTPEMQHTFVNQLGKATAGTILYAVGAALSNSGVITGGEDEDKDVADFMKNTLGIQPYSIKVGNKTFTYDWAQPIASGFAIPADIKKEIKDAKEGEVDLEYIIHESFSTAGNILLEQSFLQGIKDVLGGYGDPLDNLMSEIEGLPARAIPTLFQQINTYLDGTKRMSYGNKGTQNIISQAQAKTPWAKDLPVYRNSLGKEVKMYGGKNNFFNVFLNPANYSEGNATESAEEIYKIYQATNKKAILPRLVDSSMRNEDGTKLTNQQKSDFLKISGDIIENNVSKLIEDLDYQDMDDEDKAETIKYIVDYAYNKARKEITKHELSSTYKKAEQAEKSGYAIADYYISKQSNKSETTKTTSDRNRYQELADKGISGKIYDDFKAYVSTVKGESRTGGLTKKQKIINYIQSLPLTAQEKTNLYNDYVENSGVFQYYK